MLGESSLSPRTESTLSEKTSKLVTGELALDTDWQEEEGGGEEDADFDGHSVSSEDSFHSTVESIENNQVSVFLCGMHSLMGYAIVSLYYRYYQ